MKKSFYKLPIRFNSVFEGTGEEMPMCSEIESIDQHIELLITTYPGEHKFNKNFGCMIWEMDFERIVSRQKWEEDFTTFVLKAVREFEPRLKDPTASIQVTEVTREDLITKTAAIKKKVSILVNAFLVSTNERCGFEYTLFLGPLSKE